MVKTSTVNKKSPVGSLRSPVGSKRSPVGSKRSPVGSKRSPVVGKNSPGGRKKSPGGPVFERCVLAVKKRQSPRCRALKWKSPGCYNPWAVCHARTRKVKKN